MRPDRPSTRFRHLRSLLAAAVGAVLVGQLTVASHAAEPPRMKRADAFLEPVAGLPAGRLSPLPCRNWICIRS